MTDSVINTDPLVSLGLIDPKTFDEPSAPPSDGLLDEQRAARGEEPAAPKAESPKGDEETTALKAKVAELEGRLNAPAPAQSDLGGRNLQEDLAILQRYAADSEREFMNHPNVAKTQEDIAAGKIHPDVVRSLIQAKHGQFVAEAEKYWDRQNLRPVAVDAAARKVAKDMSTPKVQLDPTDLADAKNYPDGGLTVEAMRARAHALVNGARGEQFAARAKSGADRVEGGASPGGVDPKTIDALDPFYKIKLGLKRGGK